MPQRIVRAISIRQPYVELILRGKKVREYRSVATNIRERVHLYAGLRPGDDTSWRRIGAAPGDFVTGKIVGSVEIVGCRRLPSGGFAYLLERPVRLKRPRKPTNQPQPLFWIPKF